ncbi:MAG: hypothetical protein ABI850_08385, partial [Flavobacterium sp.]
MNFNCIPVKLKILNWLKKEKTEFEKTFSSLKRVGESIPRVKRAYDLLKELNFETSESETELLINEVNKIQYESNTNSYFYFYFPIVTHILYYKPEYEEKILGYIIEPNFANGDSETKEIMLVIQGAKDYKLS